MNFLDKYNKAQFQNVYFVTGTATGGKTTISKALAEKYGFLRYDVDEEFERHRGLSNPKDQPAMNREFSSADEFFLRDIDEYIAWLKENSSEQMPFILDDLVKLSKKQKVVCDLHLSVEEARKIADHRQIVFLIRDNNENIIEDYCRRKSHEDFNSYINSATNPILAKQNCNTVLCKINDEASEAIRNSEFFWIARGEHSTVEKTVELVEKHFGL